MNWMDFVANLVGSVAWPAVVIAAVFILRDPLVGLVPLLRRAKYKELVLEFGEKLEKVQDRVDAAQLPDPQDPASWEVGADEGRDFGQYLARLAPVSPRVVVSEAWRSLEHKVRDAARKSGQPVPRHFKGIVRTLEQNRKLSPDTVAVLGDLRALRNQAVHSTDFELEPSLALDYARVVERVIGGIQWEGEG